MSGRVRAASPWWRWRGRSPATVAADLAGATRDAAAVQSARRDVALSHLLDAAALALTLVNEVKGRLGYGYATADLLEGAIHEAEAALGRRVRP